MPAPLSKKPDSRPGAHRAHWLRRLWPFASRSPSPSEPAITRAEISFWFARQVVPEIEAALHALGRPGVVVLRCRFADFDCDLAAALEVKLGDVLDCDVIAIWPEDPADKRKEVTETVDALNGGRSRIFVLPHERVLSGHLPSVDVVLALPRFTPASLAAACQSFFDLPCAPDVPDEPWVALTCPSDLLISSAASGEPVQAIRGAARTRLREHDCERCDAPREPAWAQRSPGLGRFAHRGHP